MSEDQELQRVPESMRDYLKEIFETKKIFLWVWKELITPASRKAAGWYLLLLVLVIVLTSVQPFLLGKVFDGLVAKDAYSLLVCFGGLIICSLLQKVIHWRQSLIREWMLGENMVFNDHRITELFFEKTMGQHLQEGTLLTSSNIDRGRWKIIEVQFMILFESMAVLLTLLVSFLLLWFLSLVAGAIMTLVVAVHLSWSLCLNKHVAQICTPIEKDFRRLNRRRVERWDKMERVKTGGKEQEEQEEMDGWFNRILKDDRKFWFWFIGQCILREYVAMFGLFAVMAYSVWQTWQGNWTMGMLYPLFSWANTLNQNMWQVGYIEQRLSRNMPSIRSMIEALTIPPAFIESADSHMLHQTAPVRVAFENVSYTYPLGDTEEGRRDEKHTVPVVRNLSFSIEPGEKVALIGPSGVGKTTVMRLLLRFMDPDSGEVHVNGCLLKDIRLSSWMKLVGYIPQQSLVLDGTLRYNLTYSLSPEEREKITDDELWSLMRLLQIDFGDRLTEGLDTKVGKNGIKLSGGQAQRLMIGAAAIKKPLFMVIDEATSSLDSTTEKEVQRGLAEVLHGEVSALIVAHRLSTVREICTKFIVLRNAGEVGEGESQIEAEAGSFEELYEKSETFRRLARDQRVLVTCPV